MDSVAKSTTVGRISGPVAWIIAIILAKYFDVSVEGAEYDALTQIVGQALVYLFAAYGTVTPIISKIREKRRCVNDPGTEAKEIHPYDLPPD